MRKIKIFKKQGYIEVVEEENSNLISNFLISDNNLTYIQKARGNNLYFISNNLNTNNSDYYRSRNYNFSEFEILGIGEVSSPAPTSIDDLYSQLGSKGITNTATPVYNGQLTQGGSPIDSNNRLPVDIGGATVNIQGNINVANEVEITNDSNNPLPTTNLTLEQSLGTVSDDPAYNYSNEVGLIPLFKGIFKLIKGNLPSIYKVGNGKSSSVYVSNKVDFQPFNTTQEITKFDGGDTITIPANSKILTYHIILSETNATISEPLSGLTLPIYNLYQDCKGVLHSDVSFTVSEKGILILTKIK